MGITVNVGGYRQNLRKVWANAGGVKKELGEIRSNVGGVRQIIFQNRERPASLAWHYEDSAGESPQHSGSGFSVSNNKGTALKYQQIVSDEFRLVGKWQIIATMWGISNGAGGLELIKSGASAPVSVVSVSGADEGSGSVAADTGTYRFRAGGSYGDQAGTYSAPYYIVLSFEEAE